MKNRKSPLRKVIRGLLILIVIIIVLAIILPFIFKGRIMEAVKREINNSVEAKVDFTGFGMNLFSSFPDFRFHLDGLTIAGIKDFEGDTLARIGSVSAVIDLFSVIRGDVYEIKKITITDPDIRLILLENGSASWDIFPAGGGDVEPIEPETTEAAPVNISLRKFEIRNADIVYDDRMEDVYIIITDMDHTLSGNLSADMTDLTTFTGIGSLSFNQGGVTYLPGTSVSLDALIRADLKNEIYTFSENELRINELALKFDGTVDLAGNDPDIQLSFEAAENTFRNFLSLVPAIYQKDFADIRSNGRLSFTGFVRGTYTENALPSFGLDIMVADGEFQYPDLPAPVRNINFEANISNPGGEADGTVIDIKKFRFTMIENPVELRLLVMNPVSDPYIDGSLNGFFDLSAVDKVYPLGEGESITGSIESDITLKGRQSAIEAQQFQDFEASGSLKVDGFSYSMQGFAHGFGISHALMIFSPAFIDVVNLDFSYADSDMKLKGKTENYIPYLTGSGPLKGAFTASSSFFNINNFMEGDEEIPADDASTAGDSLVLEAFMVPADIDLSLDVMFGRVLYDNIELENVKGEVSVKDQKISLKGLRGNIFDGSIAMDGSYSTKNTAEPIVGLTVGIENMNFVKAFNTFGILEKFAPVFSHMVGSFSTDMSLNTILKEDLDPDWTTLVAQGLMNTSALKVENVNTLNRLSDALKTDAFRSLEIDPLKLGFTISEGKLDVKPFDLDIGGMKANLSGWTAIDQSIGYVMELEVPRSLFGSEANAVIDGLIGQAGEAGLNVSAGKTVDLMVLIGGTLSDPTVKPSVGASAKGVVEDLKEQVKEEFDKAKQEAEQQAKAEAKKILDEAEQQAQKVIAEARKQADLVKKTGRDAAQKVKTEADAHAAKLIEEGKKKGMLAEVAAKKTAEEYKKNAYSEADKMVAEADKKAEGIISAAGQQAARIRADAQKKVDEL